MTATQSSCPYRDFAVAYNLGYRDVPQPDDSALRVSNDHLGFPELCNLPNGKLLASTWGGYCFEVDPDSGRVAIQPRIGFNLSPALSSPTASARQPVLCSAATRVVWTELWQLGASKTSRVQTGDAVNSVALSPQGDLLATGLGSYPLDLARKHHASVDLFSTFDPSEPLARRVLPGVAVDCVVFHPTLNPLVAVTGARSQDRGHVLLLDGCSLNLLDVTETKFFSCCAAIIDAGSDRLILAYKKGIEVRPLDQLWNIELQWPIADEVFGAAYDPERGVIFLSNGQVLSLDGDEVAPLPALDKCTGLAVLGDGRLAGISRGGVLRVWETGPEWEP